jgi:hypothetical protein
LQGGLVLEGNGVSYDSQNPAMNALEDFFAKATYRDDSDQ